MHGSEQQDGWHDGNPVQQTTSATPPAGALTVHTANGEKSDEALMAAYAAGDPAAFDVLYGRHKGPLYRYFSRQLPEDQARDCFQTLWLKVINARGDYRPDAPLVSWLFAVARNVLMDHYRRSNRKPPGGDEDPDELAGDEDDDPVLAEIERQRLKDLLLDLVRGLPFVQREAWLLHQESGLSASEIARLTGTTPEGLKSRLRYARQKLKTGLRAYARQN
jgi:RNA polymerase sigma-70 factor (ECF subfamily)